MMNVFYTDPVVPRELIAACGLTPCRVTPASDTDSRAAGMCSFVSAWLEHLDRLEETGEKTIAVFSTGCDHMRRAYDLFGNGNAFLLNVPATTSGGAFNYYLAELRRLRDFLCETSGTKIDWTRAAAASWGQACAGDGDGAALVVTGGPVAATVLQALQETARHRGARIVLDATEGAIAPSLFYSAVSEETDDALEALARAYFDIPAIWKRPNIGFFRWMQGLTAQNEIEGVILLRHSFCDLWHSQGQELRARLNLPVLEIDLDGKGMLPAAAISRIEAFAEALA